MNFKYYISVVSFTLCLLFFQNNTIYAQCDPIENLQSTFATQTSVNTVYGQSFRTECTSIVESITVWTEEVSVTTNYTLNIYHNMGPNAITGDLNDPDPADLPPLIYSQNGTFAASSTETQQTIAITGNPQLVSGNRYLFMIEGTGTDVEYKNILDNGGGTYYPFGDQFNRHVDTNNWIINPNRDLKFSIDTEPIYDPQCDELLEQLETDSFERGTSTGQLITPYCEGKIRNFKVWTQRIDADIIPTLKVYRQDVAGDPLDEANVILTQVLPLWEQQFNDDENERNIVLNTPIDAFYGEHLVFRFINLNNNVDLSRKLDATDIYYPYGGLYRTNSYVPLIDLKFEAEYLDETLPVAQCKDTTLSLDANGQLTVNVSDVDNGSTDTPGVGIASITVSSNTFDCTDVGTTQTVTLTVTDFHGNSSSCDAQVTINDYSDPILIENCPTDIVTQVDPGTCETVVTYTTPTFSNACDVPTVEFSGIESGQPFPAGDTLVTYTATDSNNQSVQCSFTVTVQESELPVFTSCPTGIVQTCSVVSFPFPEATDNCGIASIELTEGLPSGSTFPNGNTLVTYTATDTSGNTAECSFIVNVNDIEAPTFTSCPPTDIAQCDPVVNYPIPEAIDNCNVASLVRISGPASGATFLEGTTEVVYEATDDAGNTTQCSFNVTVGASTPFFITCPSNLTVSNDSGTCGAVVNYVTPTVDACFDLTLETGPAQGEFFEIGNTFVRYRSTDPGTGNSTTCDFTVTVNDVEMPTAICQNITLELDANGFTYLKPSDLNNGSLDNCDLTYSINGSSSSIEYSCSDIGTTNVDLTVTDPSGNVDTCTSSVTIVDTRVPVFNCSDDLIVDIASESAFVNYTIPTAIDNCTQGITPIMTSGIPSGSEFSLGTTIVTYEATDASNNTSICSFTVTLIDSSNPEFITEWTTKIANETVTIPIVSGYTYDYTIDWGDGTIQNNQSTELTHTYVTPGAQVVKISGIFPAIDFESDQLTKLIQWGNMQWHKLDFAFAGNTYMEYAAIDVPDLSYGLINENLRGVFIGCKNLGSPDLNGWDIGGSEIRSLAGFFNGSNFNGYVSSWDVSQIRGFNGMFENTPFNGDLSSWIFTSATDMSFMFSESSFNQDISNWDVSNVTNMSFMFYYASSFDQNLGSWNVSNVNNMVGFLDNSGLSRVNFDNLLIGWDSLPSINNGQALSVGAQGLLYCDGAASKVTLETESVSFIGTSLSCDFVTTWQTTAGESITIPTYSHVLGEYNYSIDWGDGSVIETGVLGDVSHVYSTSDIRTITISGYFPAIYFNNSGDKDKILSVENWGNRSWITMKNAFYGCTKLVINTALDTPILTSLTNMESAFEDATSITTGLEFWDVSSVVNMPKLFKNATSFSDNISNWNISNVTDMTELFNGVTLPTSLYDMLLINWSSLTVANSVNFDAGTSYYCFGANAKLLLETSGWTISDLGPNCSNLTFDTKWVTTVSNEIIEIGLPSLSEETYNFIIDWGDGSALEIYDNYPTNPSHSFILPGNYVIKISGVLPAIQLNNTQIDSEDKLIDVLQWGDIKWTSMRNAFAYANNFDISATDAPDLSLVTSMEEMFLECTSLVGTDAFNNWNVSTIENMTFVFRESSFNSDVSDWDVGNVLRMNGAFRETPFNKDVNGWNMSNVESIKEMFLGATAFNQPLNGWVTTNITDMEGVFERTSVFNQDISGWNVSNVLEFDEMFEDADGFNQDISGWNTSSAQTMWRMFENATTFNQNLGDWDIGNLIAHDDQNSMEDMFIGSAISAANYDDTLIGWATDTSPGIVGVDDIPNNVRLDATVGFCLSATERDLLINTYQWTINDNGLDVNCNILPVSPKVFLQGTAINPNAGEPNLMRDNLRAGGWLAASAIRSPYVDNLTCDAAVFDITGTDAIVDWVWIELRDKDDNTSVIDSQSALLQRDGDVVGIDGVSPLLFNQASDAYYIVISHRNHLGIITANTVSLSTTLTVLDLTLDDTLIDGGINAVVQMPNGVYALYAGDYDGNGQVQNTDLTGIRPQLGQPSSYSNADIDMNGEVQNTDINNLLNPNTGKGQQFARIIDLKLFAKRK